MTMQNYFILTSGERDTALGYNPVPPTGYEVDPRLMDNASPGVGINLNDNASNYDPADPVTLTGCYILPKRIVDDPNYGSGLKTWLLTLPWSSLENETIFAPPPE
jgi:hypothetical protein